MTSTIDDAFARWTSGLDPIEARKSIFTHLRDMPYTQYPGLGIETWTQTVLETRRGSCHPKHVILGRMFARLGIPIKLVTYPMRWVDQPLEFPPRLRELARELPTVSHLDAKARLDGAWRRIDATYDPPLARIGAPVTLDWDGRGDTPLAVVALGEVEHDSEQALVDYLRAQSAADSRADAARLAAFATALDAWLDSVRATRAPGPGFLPTGDQSSPVRAS